MLQQGDIMSGTSYDPAALELAEYFLERPDRLGSQVDADRARRLAQRIQSTVDDFLEEEGEGER